LLGGLERDEATVLQFMVGKSCLLLEGLLRGLIMVLGGFQKKRREKPPHGGESPRGQSRSCVVDITLGDIGPNFAEKKGGGGGYCFGGGYLTENAYGSQA